MNNKLMFKRSTAVAVVAILMLTCVSIMSFDTDATDDIEACSFYVDLNANLDNTNGEWIYGSGTNPLKAFNNTANTTYGSEDICAYN